VVYRNVGNDVTNLLIYDQYISFLHVRFTSKSLLSMFDMIMKLLLHKHKPEINLHLTDLHNIFLSVFVMLN